MWGRLTSGITPKTPPKYTIGSMEIATKKGIRI
jgi:hypothetical protein